MQLYRFIGAGQPYAAAAGPRGKEKLKDTGTVFRRDALSGIFDANFRRFAASLEAQCEFSARGHGLNGVENQIEKSLGEKGPIDADGGKIGILFFQLHVSAFHLRPGNSADLIEEFIELSLPRGATPGKRMKSSEAFHHDRIQAVDFWAIENGHGLAWHAIARGRCSLRLFHRRMELSGFLTVSWAHGR